MKKAAKLIIIALSMLLGLSCASTTNNLYQDAMEDTKSGNYDFAYMKLKQYLRKKPNSAHVTEVKFAIIEYYFQTRNYRLAIEDLTKYITGYPNEKNTVFAQAILYKILSDYDEESPLLEKMRETFFSKSIFLIFSDSKTKSYTSLFDNEYEIVDYVDKIEVFKNKGLLFEIKP